MEANESGCGGPVGHYECAALESGLDRSQTESVGIHPRARGNCEFLRIELGARDGGFASRTQRRGILTPSAAQLARELNASGGGYWRRYRTQLAPVLPLLAGWVGYFHFDT